MEYTEAKNSQESYLFIDFFFNYTTLAQTIRKWLSFPNAVANNNNNFYIKIRKMEMKLHL